MQRLIGTSEAFTSFLHGFIEGGVRPAQSHTEVSCPAHTCHSATDTACSAAEVNVFPKPAAAEIVLHVNVARIASDLQKTGVYVLNFILQSSLNALTLKLARVSKTPMNDIVQLNLVNSLNPIHSMCI